MKVADHLLIAAVFASVTSLSLFTALLLTRRSRQAAARLRSLSEPAETQEGALVLRVGESMLPAIGRPFLPRDKQELRNLQARFVHAGIYHPRALRIYLGIKVLLVLLPVLFVVPAVLLDLLSQTMALFCVGVGGLVGMMAPSFWLDYQKRQRQSVLRRALADALDVIVICLEGGLSLRGALRRVANELWMAHPELADEMAIVEREIYMGRSTAEALHAFAGRCDLEEVRSLSNLVQQSEQFGTGLIKALNIYTEMLRVRRQQQAEEAAQKAATKIVFPTLLFIFPTLFVVLLGPAVIQLLQLFGQMK